MAQINRKKSTVKLIFWLLVSAGLISYMVRSYTDGQMIRWYYYTASVDGYAIDANTFANATEANPAMLDIVEADVIRGRQAIEVKSGGRLPENANGVISLADLHSAERACMDPELGAIRVMLPWKIKEEKGFKYKDTFKHKGIRTNPWAGLWNVVIILTLGLALGLCAEAVTDVAGVKIEKIEHGH